MRKEQANTRIEIRGDNMARYLKLSSMKKEILPSHQVYITDDNIGRRIDNFLHMHLKGVPKGTIYRMLRKGNIRVNKKRMKSKYKLQFSDIVRIPAIRIEKPAEKEIRLHLKEVKELSRAILYEDDYILAMNKPSGTAVHGGTGLNGGMIERLRMLRDRLHFLELVHRLDRDTSGVLLLAKKRSALRLLHKQLIEKEVKKDYLALVRGHWQSKMQVVKVPLLKNKLKSGIRIVRVNQAGKCSETHFKVEECYRFSTLLRCSPITGRTHQIRVHAQHVGHPIAFDNLYGDKEFDECLLETGLSRLFLHALSIKFIHPKSGAVIRIKAPLEERLKRCLQLLRDSK